MEIRMYCLVSPLPKTENFFTRCLMIPMNMTVTDDDIDFICENVASFYK